MALRLEELDDETRRHMVLAFDAEEATGAPYRGQLLSPEGLAAWPELMLAAITGGDDESLIVSLTDPKLWLAEERWVRAGVVRERKVNVAQAAGRLGTSEFNTWYVRGLSARLLAEGVQECQIYRAADPKWEPAGCSEHEDEVVSVQLVHDGHRSRYWPVEDDGAFSIPFQPGCHHSIRRRPADASH